MELTQRHVVVVFRRECAKDVHVLGLPFSYSNIYIPYPTATGVQFEVAFCKALPSVRDTLVRNRGKHLLEVQLKRAHRCAHVRI